MKKLLYTGCILLTLGVIVFAVGFFASGSDIYALDVETKHFLIDLDGSRDDIEILSEAFDLSEVKSVKIQDTWHDIKLGQSEDDMVHLVYAQDEQAHYNISLEGGTLKIDFDENWDGKLVRLALGTSADTSLQLLLPEGSAAKINVLVGSGNVDISNCSTDLLTVETGSGDINGGQLSCELIALSSASGRVRIDSIISDACALETKSGDINCGSVKSDLLSLSSSSGSIDLTAATADELTAASSSGDINLSELTVSGSGRFSASSGSIYAALKDSNSSYRVEAVTASGNIHVDNTLLNGNIPLRVSTSSGDINISTQN